MNWLLRPSLLLVASTALAVTAIILIIRAPGGETRLEPRPLLDGDQELVFLYQANSGATWERFVAAAEQLHAQRGVPFDASRAYPKQTTDVPELVIQTESGGGRLVFRWYKLTGTQKAGDWVDALLSRSRPPLAFIGGSTSDAALELADELNSRAARLPVEKRPLLLLTTATADFVEQRGIPEAQTAPDEFGVRLTEVYKDRTFRFCFTNRQMAGAVIDFLWSQPDLRPDPDPVYYVYWNDDSYSKDLATQFEFALNRAGSRAVARECGWALGLAATGAYPWHLALPRAAPMHTGAIVPAQNISSSVGTFDQPNRWEWDAARWHLEEFRKQGARRRPLLVLTGQSKPSRRFLRAMEQNDRANARQFIVACGDSLAFNTVFRDRDVAWPIQDLPFDLVLYCHRNPVDSEAGFQPDGSTASEPISAGSTGTEDKLLFEDLLAALVDAASGPRGSVNSITTAERLRSVRVRDRLLFRPNGNRQSATGEHVVWLRPTVQDGREIPEATLTVWSAVAGEEPSGRWQLAAPPRIINYEKSLRGGGGGNAGN
jgi:hypothetical protein